MRLLPLISPFALFVVGCGEGRLVATFEESFTIDAATELLLDNGSGDLSIVGESDRSDVTLFVELRSHRASELADDEAKAAVVIDVRSLDDATGQLVASLHDAPPGYHIDVTAIVPAHVAMRVDDDSGDIGIEGIAAIDLHDDSGDVRIEAIAGDVGIDDDSGDIAIVGVQGHVDIEDGSGDINVRDVGADAFVRDDSGDIAIVSVAGTVTLRDGSGDIFVGDAGDVRVETDGSGDVRIE
jgi:hypothetical protein